MPTSPVVQSAATGWPCSSQAGARPLSQSMIALVPSVSFWSPTVGQPVGEAGADALAQHYGVATRNPVVVQGARQVRDRLRHRPAHAQRATVALRRESLLGHHVVVDVVVHPAAGVVAVGTVLEDHGHPDAGGLGLARTGEPQPYPVALAVQVGVDRGLDVQRLLDRVCQGELRLGGPVLDLQPRGWRGQSGRPGGRAAAEVAGAARSAGGAAPAVPESASPTDDRDRVRTTQPQPAHTSLPRSIEPSEDRRSADGA